MIERGLLAAILSGYALPPLGLHGLPHWARVLENGLRLAPATGADPRVVLLFALLHDARRVGEGRDPAHGARSAALARSLGAQRLGLGPAGAERLRQACAFHSEGGISPDPHIQTCWDADRLDLPRCGIRIDPDRLGTAAARDPELVAWAGRRAADLWVPARVRREWLPLLARLQAGSSQLACILPGSRTPRMW
jgi:uncharacterized protein